MNPEDYVSYPIALALKKAGFDEPCDHHYDIEDAPEGCYWEGCSLHKKNHNEDIPKFSAPSLWQAQKWLRDRCGIHVYTTLESVNEVSYDCHIVHLHKDAFRVNKRYCSYESALSAGIAAALELIGEKGE